MAKKQGSASLQNLLFDNRNTDKLGFAGGKFSDRFVPPRTIIRDGIFSIEGSDEYEGIHFHATITLQRLVRKKKA